MSESINKKVLENDLHSSIENEIAPEAPLEYQHYTADELEKIDSSRRKKGMQLANQVYELTNVVRESKLSIYIETVHKFILETSSEENQAILETAKQFFLDNYSNQLKGKGQSPKMIDQIVHRTGRDTRLTVAKLLQGFDVELIANEIWELSFNKDPNAHKKVLSYMQDLTQAQVRELRVVYNSMPAKKLAYEIHKALEQKDLLGQRKPNKEAIIYLLKGRSVKEVKQIECHFNEIYHFNRYGEKEQTLREQIISAFPEEHAEIFIFLDGFSEEYFAHRIYEQILNCAEAGEGNTNCESLHPDFAGKFRADPSEAKIWIKELRARDAIGDIVYYFSKEQFIKVNNKLLDLYQFKITPELYTSHIEIDERDIALKLYKAFFHVEKCIHYTRYDDYLSEQDLYHVKDEFRLSNNKDLRDIIKYRALEVRANDCMQRVAKLLTPLEFLGPDKLNDVYLSFRATTGVDLFEFVKAGILDTCREDVPTYVEELVFNRLSGISRIKLDVDLFSLFPSAEKRIEQAFLLERNSEAKAKAIERARSIADILNRNIEEEEKVRGISKIVNACSEIESHLLEKKYLDLNDKKLPLIREIQSKFSPEKSLYLEALMSGFDPEKMAEIIYSNPKELLNLKHIKSDYIDLLLRIFERKYNLSLRKFILKKLSDSEESQVHALSIIYKPEAKILKQLLATNEKLEKEQLEQLLVHLRKKEQDLLAFESSYNSNFSRFRLCYEKFFGTLMQRLRVLATHEIIPRPYFAKATLLMEELDEQISESLFTNLQIASESKESLTLVQNLLRRNSKKLITIRKSYNALDKDNTLRDAISALNIRLHEINKSLLMLDGFDPISVAETIITLIKNKSGEELGKAICYQLSEKTNPKCIPKHTNWIQEMRHQIRVAFEDLTQKKLVAVLFSKDVPLKGQGIHAIAYALYGNASKSAINLATTVKEIIVHEGANTTYVQELIKKLECDVPGMRERALDMYNAYFVIPKKAYVELDSEEFKNLIPEMSAFKIKTLVNETKDWDLPTKEHSKEEVSSFLDALDAAVS